MKVIAIAAWRRRTRRTVPVFDLQTWPNQALRDYPRTHYELGKRMGAMLRLYEPPRPWTLAVEDTFIFKNPKSAIIQGRNSGMMAGPLEGLAAQSAYWVKAVTWRKHLLGIAPFTGRGKAKRQTYELLPASVRVCVDRAAVLLDASSEDIADAAGVCLWLHSHVGGTCLGVDPGTTGAAMLVTS